ncbi:MAG: efflux RND transporter permease subunit [Dichotomicrobium sp.]
MGLTELCVRRPVFATVLSLIVFLLGLVAYERLNIREYPNIDPPVVNVNTTYQGASAAIIETQVTQVLEESLAGIEGVDYITSISREEESQITVNFRLARDPDSAAADVRDRVSRVRGRLPEEIEEPVIQKVEADAQPVIYLAFSSEKHSSLEITDYADRYVKDQLQTLPGVAEVRIFGERVYSMRLWLDPLRMAAYDLAPQDIENALRRQNVEVPAGRIESRMREFTVLSETDLRTPEQFNDLVIKREDGYLVRLQDIGQAKLGPLDERRVVRFNGEPAIALGVIKQATANPLDVSDAVREVLPRVLDTLPDGMKVEVAHDKSVFIQESLDNVYITIGEAVILVLGIIFFFLHSVRATFIPLVTIPVSLVGAFALMFMFGFSINTLTLLAFVLAIGLVVDDSIVMLENIHRHVEEGEHPFTAAIRGSKEIAFAIVAMTLTLAAVYIPIGFLTGKTGRLFTEFAWTLAGAVLVSGFVALTLSPMMCSKLLKHETHQNVVIRAIEWFIRRLIRGYRALLGLCLRARPLILAIGLAVAGGGAYLFTQLNSELAPYEDQGTIVSVFTAPQGATIDYTDKYAKQLEGIFAETDDVARYFVVSGFPTVTQGIGFVKMAPWDERDRTQQEIAQELRPKMFGVPGVMAFPVNPPPLGQSVRDQPIQLVVLTSEPYAKLNGYVEQILQEAQDSDMLQNLDSDLRLNKPQLKVDVDRDKVAALDVDIETLGRTLETLLGGRQVTRFKREGQQYDVVVQVEAEDRVTPGDLEKIYVRSNTGAMIQLSNLVTLRETVAPKELNHFNQLRSATFTATLADGATLGEALTEFEEVVRSVIPPSAQIDYGGQSREFKESSAEIYVTFILALAFIYLVLAAQFESFIDPLTIMLTVPLSITGGLLGLYLTGGTLNIYSQVGLVTLIGLITKHGILLVEFSNQMRQRGKDIHDAVLEAATLRLRPILMTTGAMTFGSVPLALASGAGAESRQSIGVVIVGGLLVGTLFTLFVIPVVYTYFARSKRPGPITESEEAPAGSAPSPAE